LANILHIDAYQLFEPITAIKPPTSGAVHTDEFMFELEGKIIKFVKQQFEDAKDVLNSSVSAKGVR
jgi:hypothetical protein